MIKTYLLAFVFLFFNGCSNPKKEAFQNGEKLVCVEHNFFSSDKTYYLNQYNSDLGLCGGNRFYDGPEGIWYEDECFIIDDCYIYRN